MKHAVMAALFLAAGSAAAFGQDERDKRVEELKREFERTMKGLQQKFELERERLEKEFRGAQERLLEKKGEAPEKKGKEPRGVEDLLREILKRVESLEKKLDGELPRFREFDFKRVPQGMPEEFRKWLEQMPKFKKEEDFRFEFKKSDKPEKKADAPEKKEEKKKGEAPEKKEEKKKPQKEED